VILFVKNTSDDAKLFREQRNNVLTTSQNLTLKAQIYTDPASWWGCYILNQ
jgi:hypothetical protein